MEGLSPGSGSLKPRTYIRGEKGRRKTGRQDWTQEGLVASATGPFVLLHVPESHPFRGERSQVDVTIYQTNDPYQGELASFSFDFWTKELYFSAPVSDRLADLILDAFKQLYRGVKVVGDENEEEP